MSKTRNADLLPEAAAAGHIGKHPKTLQLQRRLGTLPFPHLKIGGRYFYRREHLDAFLRDCEIAPARRSA